MQQPAESPKSANRGLALFSFFLNFIGIVLMVVWTPLKWLLRQVFGNLDWQAPAWLHWSARRGYAAAVSVRRHPRHALIGLVAVLLLAGGGWYGYHWWQARPKPVEVTFKADNPGRTEIEQDDPANRLPKPLVIKFDHSVATLAAVGKDVSSGITVSPAIAGVWHWNDDKTLSFAPTEDWPVGREYKLSFDKQLFSPEIRLAQYDTTFSSAAFMLNIARTEFYQDPVNPAIKQAVVELHFSHPVNPAELEKRIELQLDQQSSGVLGIGKETTPFTVTYDKLKLNAYIRSATLPIPKDGSRMTFTLAKGITAARGSPASDQPLSAQIEVPGLYSLAISEMQPQVVTNDKNEPEQVLLLQTSATVHEREMQKAISAWVLPKFHPENKDHNEDDPAESWSTGEITPAILQQSRRLPLEAIPAEHEYTDSHSFKYRADVGAQIYVQVEAGLKSFGGYLLGKADRRVVGVPPFPPELKILSQGALLTMSGEKKVAVLVRDLPGVKVEIGRVQTSQLQHLVSQADGNFANPEFYGRFGPDNLTERFESKIPLPNLERGRAHYEAVDMSQYLKGDGEARRGVFLLTVSGYDPAAEAREKKEQDKNQRQPGEPVAAENDADCGDNCGADGENGGNGGNEGQSENKVDKRLVIVTDLGLLVKKSLDGSQDIFVQSIFSGKPVDGAIVDIIGKNGITLFSQTTDAGGRAHFAKIEGLSRERAPLMVMVRKGGDLSFMPLNKSDRALDMSRFDVGGANNAAVADQVSAYLFSDRGIYRPGDTFHIGIIAKSANWAGSITGLPLEAEVLDARGLTVKREKIKLPAGGFSELSYTTQDSAPTGTYNVNLYLVRDGRAGAQVGSTSVKVQEFQPDRIKVSAKFSAPASEGWLNPKDLTLAVNAQNLFGTPAENRRVTAELTLTPAFPAFKQFPAYTFYDPQRAKEGYNEQLAEQTTDDKGDARFDLGLAKYAKATYRLQVLTRTYEPQGGRGVAAEAATLVSELPYMIGFKADGGLNFVSRGSHRTVSIIGLDPKAQKTAVAGLTLQQIERKYVSVLTKQADGGYKYESRKKEILLKESPLAIPAAGFNLTLASDTPGNFAYVIRDALGLEFNRIEYAVAGKGNVSRSLERNAELQLTLDKKDYVPGDEIEVSIRAPYTGAGLITIERNKVFTHQWFKADTLASVQKIRLPKDFEGNGYISVQFIRDPSSEEIFMSPLSYGVAPFATSLAARTNKLTLSTPDLVKPGQQLKMKLTASQPTRVVVFAVDEGILQVARYQMADPLGFFFQKKMLEVRTSQILDLILPEFKKLLAASAPGGDAEGALGKHLNPFKRKHDKPAVYWSGIVDLNGEQEFNYQVPDTFNGSMRVMAVAVNDGAIGTAQTKALVRGDFVISPNAPLAVTPGDEFDVSVGVANNVADAGKDAAVSLTLKTSPHLQVIGNATQTLKIGAMREGVASYRVKAVDGAQAMLGSASLNFSASLGGGNSGNNSKTAKLSTDVSVRPPVARYTQLTVGSFSGSAEVPVKRNMYPQYRKLEAGVSVLPLVLADGLADYLANFPHLCTEQMVSQAIPALILSKRPEFGKSDLKPATARSFDDALKVLRTRQNAEGGFGLWNASVEVDEFASIYALHLLLEGRERGETVPPDMLQKGLDYAQKLAASPGAELWQLRVRAYAAYLLTRQMVVTTPILTSIRETLERRYPKEWQSDLAAAYLAAAYQLQKQDSLASKLIDKQVEHLVKPEASFDYGHYYDPLIHDAQLLYLLSRHFPARVKALPPAVITALVKPIADGRFNTLSSAYLILAFDAYANSVGAEGLGKLAIAEVDASGKQHPLTLPNNLVPRVGFAAGTAKLRFGNDSKLSTYYAVTETGFDKAVPKEELRAGIEVLREFVGADGKPVSAVKVGDELTVRLKFRAVGRQSVWNAALVDLMPGGFEPVLDTPSEPAAGTADGSTAQVAPGSALAGLAGAKSNWNISYADVREDRVVFYGTVGADFSEITYRIKATNSGRFVVPPAYAESMYERGVQARSAGGQSLTVEAPGKK